MSFELPKKVKIGPINFIIRHKEFDQEESFNWGEFDNQTGEIGILEDQHPELKQDTVLHEAFHAAFFVSGWHPPQEERIVRTLSPLILGMIKDNPELMMYLMESYESIPSSITSDTGLPS